MSSRVSTHDGFGMDSVVAAVRSNMNQQSVGKPRQTQSNPLWIVGSAHMMKCSWDQSMSNSVIG